MTTQNTTAQSIGVLEELIDNASKLPVGSQDLLLMMAKAMRHTRDCMNQQDITEQFRKESQLVSEKKKSPPV